MSFYQRIAPYYQYIFKINAAQINFVKSKITDNEVLLLDVGCGIGTLSFELASYYKNIIGIDLDAEMIHYADNQLKNNPNAIEFHQLSMLDISKKFDENTFDGVVCFGNTLVHLSSLAQVRKFLLQSKSVLKSDGKLLMQIVNYDRILSKQIQNLPFIENDYIQFERIYNYDSFTNRIDFKTCLTVKSTQEKIENSVVLLPILQVEINQLLQETGFENCNLYGNFNQELFSIDSPALIIEAW